MDRDELVTPRAGVWIEIAYFLASSHWHLVTPRAGVWIEIFLVRLLSLNLHQSLPVRECGLKYPGPIPSLYGQRVTPRAGVWIEISGCSRIILKRLVTPRAGVWIEIPACHCQTTIPCVTPRAGVWIEIMKGE